MSQSPVEIDIHNDPFNLFFLSFGETSHGYYFSIVTSIVDNIDDISSLIVFSSICGTRHALNDLSILLELHRDFLHPTNNLFVT